MSDVTRILSQIESGDPSAAEQLLPLVYDELRKLAAAKLAQEKPGQTLQATALVHEAYLRLVDVEAGPALEQPRPFLCGGGGGDAADSGRAMPAAEGRLKRGGERQRVDSMHACSYRRAAVTDLLALDEALTKLAATEPGQGRTGQAAFLCRPDDAPEPPTPSAFRWPRPTATGLTPGPGCYSELAEDSASANP